MVYLDLTSSCPCPKFISESQYWEKPPVNTSDESAAECLERISKDAGLTLESGPDQQFDQSWCVRKRLAIS